MIFRYLRVLVLLSAFSYVLVFRCREGGPLALVFFQNLFGDWPQAQWPGWLAYAVGLLAPLVRSDRVYARWFTIGWICQVLALVVVLMGADLLLETVISGTIYVVLAVALPWYEWFRAGLESAGLRSD